MPQQMTERAVTLPREVRALLAAREALLTGEAQERRRAAGLSQREFAAVAGISQQTVCAYEQQRRRPRGAAGTRYAVVLAALPPVPAQVAS